MNKIWICFLLTMIFSSPLHAAKKMICKKITTTEIENLFDNWNSALQTLDPNQVVALYDKKSVLLPTVSNKPRVTREEKMDYFNHFLEKKPVGEIDSRNIILKCNSAIDAGLYTFTFADGSKAQARYTFTYRWNGTKWLISSHHSSFLPEKH